MSTTLSNGTITFPDGTTQSTKTPTVTSAFTNNSGYITDADISPTYALKTQALSKWNWSGYALSLNTYNTNGVLVQSQYWNCNCNC